MPGGGQLNQEGRRMREQLGNVAAAAAAAAGKLGGGFKLSETVTTSNNGRSKRPPLPTAASSSCSRHKFSHKYSPHWRYRAKTPLVH